MNLAIHAPERVNRLVLIGPMGLPSWFTTLKVLSHLWTVLLRPTPSNIDNTIRWALGEDPRVRQSFSEILKGGVSSRSQIKLAPPLSLSSNQLRKIAAPTLLILGERDNVIGSSRAASDRARRFIPSVQIGVIPGAGHIMSMEASAAVNALMVEFLSGRAHP